VVCRICTASALILRNRPGLKSTTAWEHWEVELTLRRVCVHTSIDESLCAVGVEKCSGRPQAQGRPRHDDHETGMSCIASTGAIEYWWLEIHCKNNVQFLVLRLQVRRTALTSTISPEFIIKAGPNSIQHTRAARYNTRICNPDRCTDRRV
jgi:hypothetical protein